MILRYGPRYLFTLSISTSLMYHITMFITYRTRAFFGLSDTCRTITATAKKLIDNVSKIFHIELTYTSSLMRNLVGSEAIICKYRKFIYYQYSYGAIFVLVCKNHDYELMYQFKVHVTVIQVNKLNQKQVLHGAWIQHESTFTESFQKGHYSKITRCVQWDTDAPGWYNLSQKVKGHGKGQNFWY